MRNSVFNIFRNVGSIFGTIGNKCRLEYCSIIRTWSKGGSLVGWRQWGRTSTLVTRSDNSCMFTNIASFLDKLVHCCIVNRLQMDFSKRISWTSFHGDWLCRSEGETLWRACTRIIHCQPVSDTESRCIRPMSLICEYVWGLNATLEYLPHFKYLSQRRPKQSVPSLNTPVHPPLQQPFVDLLLSAVYGVTLPTLEKRRWLVLMDRLFYPADCDIHHFCTISFPISTQAERTFILPSAHTEITIPTVLGRVHMLMVSEGLHIHGFELSCECKDDHVSSALNFLVLSMFQNVSNTDLERVIQHSALNMLENSVVFESNPRLTRWARVLSFIHHCSLDGFLFYQ